MSARLACMRFLPRPVRAAQASGSPRRSTTRPVSQLSRPPLTTQGCQSPTKSGCGSPPQAAWQSQLLEHPGDSVDVVPEGAGSASRSDQRFVGEDR